MKKLTKYIRLCLFDKRVRENIFTLFGIIFTAFYVVFNIILGIVYESAWFVSLAAYYGVALILRYSTLDSDGDQASVGALLSVLSLSMSAMIVYTVAADRVTRYSAFVFSVLGAYTVFSLFRSVYAIIKHKEWRRRIFYKIRLVLALLSLFNLQISVLSTLGIDTRLARGLNFITGAAIIFSSFAIARRASCTPSQQ